MKAIILLAKGFEEIEALTPADVLRRAGIEVQLVSINDELNVTGAHGITVVADALLKDITAEDGEINVLVLPGGLEGTNGLKGSYQVKSMIESCTQNGSYIAAICAAPSVLGQLGLLDHRNIACYPGFEEQMPLANRTGEKIEVDDIFITAEGMGVSTEFSLKIVAALLGEETADSIEKQIRKA